MKVDPVSSETRTFFMDTTVIFLGLISTFGIGANTVNIVVFVKQGFKDSINISLLGLAVADLACVVTIFWSSVCLNPLIVSTGLPFASLDVMYITGGWPHLLFNRITSFITAFITLERCLCVTMPFKIKSIITEFRTKIIIVSIFIILMAIFSPVWCVNKLEWNFIEAFNTTKLILVTTDNREIVEGVSFFIHSVLMSTVCLIAVLISTVILTVKLSMTSNWRKTAVTFPTNKEEKASIKDKKVMKMINLIAAIFVVCFLPGTVIFLAMVVDPQISIGGRYENSFVIVWSVGFLMETISSSINIVVYMKMSSKFKVTLVSTFCGHFKA